MPELGKLTAVFDADTRKFDASIRGVGAKVVALETNLKGLSSGGTAAISTVSGLAGPLAIASGAAVIAASAIGGVVSGLFDLVKSSAKVGGELFDLSQKTSFTVETLSGLSIIAKTTGSDINAISSSLIIFQKNMGAAQDVTSKQGQLFKSLNIDTRDNEKALRQAFTTLAKYGDTQKAVELSTKLFGRSGAAVLAMVKETNGNLDAAIKKYGDMGLIISGQAAAASDKFNDVLEETTLQLQAVTRSIGMELLPVATETLQTISANLKANKDEWASWGTSISNVVRGLTRIITSEVGQWIGTISAFLVKYASVPGLIVTGLSALGAGVDRPSEDPFGPGGAARGGRQSLPGTPEWKAMQKRMADLATSAGVSAGGGGGGGGGRADNAKRIAELQLQAVVEGLNAEQEANRRSLDLRRQDFNKYATEYIRLENKRHQAVMDGLDAEAKASKGDRAKLQEVATKRIEEDITHEQNRNKVLDERGKIVDQINDFLRDQERQIVGLTSASDSWDQAYQQLVDTLKEEGVELESNTKKRIEANIELAKERDLVLSVTRARQVLQSVRERFVTKAGKERPNWIDLGGGSTVGGEPGTTTRPRVATVELQVMRERMEIIRSQMRDLGYELTDIWYNSVKDGFSRGIESGLETLAQGLLRIVEDVFLKRMAEGLSQMLGNLGTGGGGGGFFSGLFKAVLGAAIGGVAGGGIGSAGGIGGAASGVITSATPAAGWAGSFASGGYIPPGQWGTVGEEGPEPAYGGKTGLTIQPMNKGATVVNNTYHIQLPPDTKGSYNSPKSRRQLSDALVAALEATRT